jgi:ATP-dependent DNA ligase
MQQFLQDIIDEGGEGIILRDPLCPYRPGRSGGFLKHKVTSHQTQSEI